MSAYVLVEIEVQDPDGYAEYRPLAAESLAKLRPAFDPQGSVTAGNASQISDGGAAVVVCSAAKAQALGRKPIARITGYATGGMAPEWVMMAPVVAVKKLWEKTGTKASSFDLYELNEPFCVASIAVVSGAPKTFGSSRVAWISMKIASLPVGSVWTSAFVKDRIRGSSTPRSDHFV